MKIIYSLIIASLFVAGCNEDSTSETVTTSADTTNPFLPTANAPLTLDTTPNVPAINTQPNLNNQTSLPPAVNNAPKTTTPAKSGVVLNPAHGQPGHRCDLEVGAPLNGSGAKANSPAIDVKPAAAITPALPSTPSFPAANSAGVKLNPAHGQPGHDCAIPVGQPLKN